MHDIEWVLYGCGEELTEQHACDRGNVPGIGRSLDGDHGDLEGNAPSGTSEDLVADPFTGRRVCVKGVQQTRSDGGEDTAANEHGLVVSSSGDDTTAGNGSNGDSNDHGQVADAAHGGRGAVNRLEVDGDVVDGGEEATGEDEGVGGHDQVGAIGVELGRDHGALALVPLENTPHHHDENEADEETNDGGRVPVVSDTAVLDSEEVGDGSAHDEGDAGEVHLQNLLGEGSLLGDGVLGHLEEEEDDGGRDGTDGQVDVEAPAPRDVVGEGAAQEGTDDAGEAVRGADETGKGRALLGRGGEGDDGVGTGAETCCSDAGNGAAGDEGVGGWGGTADDGADLKDEDGHEEGRL